MHFNKSKQTLFMLKNMCLKIVIYCDYFFYNSKLVKYILFELKLLIFEYLYFQKHVLLRLMPLFNVLLIK